MPRAPETPMGYAAPPGTGPAGETCRGCGHAEYFRNSNRAFWKCAQNRARWSHSRRTDILLRSPACSRWTPRQEAAGG